MDNETEETLEATRPVEVPQQDPEMDQKAAEEVFLTDSSDYINENAALDQIKQILGHPGLRNPANLRRRLWQHLHTIMGAQH